MNTWPAFYMIVMTSSYLKIVIMTAVVTDIFQLLKNIYTKKQPEQ